MTSAGTTNELNAGYAADGYARLRGLGALCTTFGTVERAIHGPDEAYNDIAR